MVSEIENQHNVHENISFSSPIDGQPVWNESKTENHRREIKR